MASAQSSSADDAPAPPPIPSADLSPSTSSAAPSTTQVPAPTASSPPLARALQGLDVLDPSTPQPDPHSSVAAPATVQPPPIHLQQGSKRRRSSTSSASGSGAVTAPPHPAGHRGTTGERSMVADGNSEGNALAGRSLVGCAGESADGNTGSSEATGGSDLLSQQIDPTAPTKAPSPLARLSSIQTTSTARNCPPQTFNLPTFPVLPPSQPGPNQTFQTPSQVSSILSLPPPLLLQLARTDSPQEQLAIAEKASAGSYLSSMAIPPPSPTTLVNDMQKAGVAGSSAPPPASSSALASSSSSGPSAPSFAPTLTAQLSLAETALSLSPLPNLPTLSSLAAAASTASAHPAIPLLLGQGFSPPTPGVLAPIPGIPGVGEALRLAVGGSDPEADGVAVVGEFKPRYASVEDWSFKAAKEQVNSSSSSLSSTRTLPPPASPAGSSTPRPGLPHSASYTAINDAEIASLALQMKKWALAEQEKQVEQQVVEAKSAAVLLAAQAAAASANSPSPDEGPSGTEAGVSGAAVGGGAAGELDLSEYAEAYKKQLDALASGYFARLHRDALERLTEAVEEEGEGEEPSTTSALPTSKPAVTIPPYSSSSLNDVPTLSSSQAPTLTSLTSLTSSRPKAEAMHVRASAAAAVAAQVMAAKDLARSAGERLVSLGAAGEARRVVEEVREVASRRGSSGEVSAVPMARGGSGKRGMEEVEVGVTGAPAMEREKSAEMMAIEAEGERATAGPSLAGLSPSTASQARLLVADTTTTANLSSTPPVPPDAAAAASTLPSSSLISNDTATLADLHPEAPPPHSQPFQPSDLASPSVLASVSTPQKRDYLLSYAHALYAKDASSDELLPLLHTIESVHPDHLPTLLLISCVYYTRGELESSLWYNKRLLGFDPTYVEAMSNIGTTLRAMGKWTEAENWWWKAIKLRPTYWDATENLLGVLCNPTPQGTPAATAAATAAGEALAPTQPRYHDALALCDYVESQIFTPAASPAHPAVPPSAAAFLTPLSQLPRPRPLPPTVPYNHVHRLQNLFYAKGNLRLALGDNHAAQDEYEKAVEVALSPPEWANQIPGMQWPVEGCSVRDLVVVATVVGRILAAYAQGGSDPSLVARTAASYGVADERGGIQFDQLFHVVRTGGEAYIAKLLEQGGGVLPTVLLEPHLLAQLPGMLFAESRGNLPSLLDPAIVSGDPSTATVVDPARKTIEQSAKQTTSTMLLTLAKMLQDSLSPTSDVRRTIGGIPASQSLLLPLYYVALALYPSPSTCNNLGILLSTLNATTLIGHQDPKMPPAVLTGQQLALRYYHTGLKLDARHPHLYTNLGSLLKDMGKLPEAVEMYKRAVEYNPTFDVALANLANAVKDTGQIQESVPYYKEAVRLNPQFPEAVCGLINALGGICDWHGRGGVGEEWLVDPHKNLIHAPAAPGRPLARQGYMAQISDLVVKQLQDGYSYGLGSLASYGNLDDWLGLISSALYGTTPQQAGDLMQVWVERFTFLLSDFDRRRSQINEGGYLIRLIERLMRRIQRRWYLAEFGKTAYLGPDATAPKRIKATQADVGRYRRPPLPPSLPPIPVATVLPFHCFTLPVTARETRLISHRTGLRISHSTLNQPWMPPIVYPPPRPPRDGKINVGYVSSDLGNHPLSHLMQSVFGYHSSRFNIFVYATSPSDKSTYRLKIERESQHFFDVSRESTQQIVDRIVHDEIHVLINLSGYTKGARNEVFAARPAPVQMSYMGFASTLSAGWCDYFIVDPIVCPPHLVSGNQWRYWAGMTNTPDASRPPTPTDFEGDIDPEGDSELFVYTEKLIYLPHSYFVTDHKQAWREDENVGLNPNEPPVTSSLPLSEEVTWALEEDKRLQMRKSMFPNIRDDTVIFANWNQLYKIDPFIFRIWLNILKKHPNSILWLLRFPAPGEAHLKATAAQWAGQDVADRVIFTDVANKNEHIHRGRIADLFLDTTECNAHTTAADILWSGTPILTFPRHPHKMCSRVGASIAVATGLGPQMIVSSAEEYERRALELASGLLYDEIAPDSSKPSTTLEGRPQRRGKGELAELRKKLFLTREQSPLFDTKRWVQNLEKGLVEAWERWVSGAEFEDLPEWAAQAGPARSTPCIWVNDDKDGQNIPPRQPWF
ncbi:hypothetical protein JCM11641_004994 [Rhodosporidiobolus odoratus]